VKTGGTVLLVKWWMRNSVLLILLTLAFDLFTYFVTPRNPLALIIRRLVTFPLPG